MGDIMRILKHVKNVTTKYAETTKTTSTKSAQEKLLRPSPRRDSPPIQSSSSKSNREKDKDARLKEKNVTKEVKSSVSSRLGPQISKPDKMEVDEEVHEKPSGEINKSVFNRLGSQSKSAEKTSPSKSIFERLSKEEDKTSPNKNIFERLGPEAERSSMSLDRDSKSLDRDSRSQSPQDARVTSSTEPHTPGKGEFHYYLNYEIGVFTNPQRF